MPKETVWVVVADSRCARIFEGGRTGALTEVESLVNPAAGVPERELSRDAPGRATTERGGRRQAFEPRSTKRRIALKRHAAHVAERIGLGWQKRRYARLYVIAEPATLGELRQALANGPPVTLDLPVDVVHESAERIRELLPDWL